MNHAVLLGDSIFDNAAYVPGKPSVIEQLRKTLPGDWKATLLAVDGDVTADVQKQIERLPDDATHLIVSSGGNDLRSICRLSERGAGILYIRANLFSANLSQNDSDFEGIE